jgi:hypothetical protein
MSQKMKARLKTNFPEIVDIKRNIDRVIYNGKVFLYEITPGSKTSVFSEKFLSNGWAGKESVSGHGSDFIPTQTVREELPQLLKELHIESLLDAPCGDFYWMNLTNLDVKKYIGIDVVPGLIQENQEKYGSESKEFLTLDITRDSLPHVDLILCRDCLVHLSFRDISAAIRQFKQSGSTYLLTTTYPGLLAKNENILTGDWRPIDLEKPPFNFPKPIKLIHEESAIISDLKEKSLALWKIDNIHV